MSHQVFTHAHRVTYSDCTVRNHVYYGRFLDFLEEARGEFFRSLGTTFLQYEEQGVIFPVLDVQLKYRGPARYDEVLKIELWIAQMRSVKVMFAYRVLNAEGKLLVEGTTIHACTSTADKPMRIPEELTGKLEGFLKKE
ncbi:MAG: 4-hydroxybenzoyl-CoA thioesterase family active site protein [Verrucomicrobia bacterium]|nr:4-hydroxybenzoyl-CoA thioesterase family active site protein [Verrucomicrobiota bacterium]